MARRRRSSKLGAAKVCRVVRGRVVCKSKKMAGLAGRRRRSRAMGAMPRNAKGQFKKRR